MSLFKIQTYIGRATGGESYALNLEKNTKENGLSDGEHNEKNIKEKKQYGEGLAIEDARQNTKRVTSNFLS